MVLNLVHAGTALVVWNRSPDKSEPLRAAGASVAGSPAEVFRRTGVVILMLVDVPRSTPSSVVARRSSA
jgi:3-hydroxyisobutyrate dehydrogenase